MYRTEEGEGSAEEGLARGRPMPWMLKVTKINKNALSFIFTQRGLFSKDRWSIAILKNMYICPKCVGKGMMVAYSRGAHYIKWGFT